MEVNVIMACTYVGADPNVRDVDDRTTLHAAACSRYFSYDRIFNFLMTLKIILLILNLMFTLTVVLIALIF